MRSALESTSAIDAIINGWWPMTSMSAEMQRDVYFILHGASIATDGRVSEEYRFLREIAYIKSGGVK